MPRLFVALDLPDGWGPALADQMERIGKASQFAGCRPNWTAPKNLHITLEFLGAVDEVQVPTIARCVQQTLLGRGTFRIDAGRPELFPPGRQPRIISVPIRGDVARLCALQSDLRAALRGAGLSIEERSYSPHITLARLKQLRGTGALDGILRKSKFELAPRRDDADIVTIYESELRPEGPVYMPRLRLNLREPPDSVSSSPTN